MKIVELPKEVLEKAGIVSNIFDTMNIVEAIVSDDFSEDIEWDLSFGKLKTEKEKNMAEKLGLIYKIVHSNNPQHPCFTVHEDWREETKELIKKVNQN